MTSGKDVEREPTSRSRDLLQWEWGQLTTENFKVLLLGFLGIGGIELFNVSFPRWAVASVCHAELGRTRSCQSGVARARTCRTTL